MATATEGPQPPTYGVDRLWRGAAVAAVGLWVAWLAVPSQLLVVKHVVLYPAGDFFAAAAVLVGVRRYRPRAPSAWLLIAVGLVAFGIADLVYGLFQVVGVDPFPSLADVFYLAAYPLFALGLHVASTSRVPQGDRGGLIDASIITVTAGLFAFLLIANQYINDPEIPLAPTIVASAYPLADVLVLALAVRFLLAVQWRTPSLVMLALGLCLVLSGDVVYSVTDAFTTSGSTTGADALLMAGVLVMGLAGLHPTMTQLTTEPAEVRVPEYSVHRVVSLYLVSMVPVAVLAVQAVIGDVQNAWITIFALVLIVGLVLARFIDLAGQSRAATRRGAVLSRFTSAMLQHSGRADLLAVAAQTVAELAPAGRARVVDRGEGGVDEATQFAVPVEVGGEVTAWIVADREAATWRGVRDALGNVAGGLSVALERERLIEAQKASAASLAAQNAQLRELDRMKDQLVSSVSHELRTPLTSLGGYIEMMLEGEAGELTADQRHFAEVIDRNCRRLNRIIDDILFVARVDAGKLSLERAWVDVPTIAAASLETVRARAQQNEVAVTLTAPDPVPQVWADAGRLSQMFDNLLSNAVKFTPPGGTVDVEVRAEHDILLVVVQDTGMGIPQDEVAHLFERFFRTSTVGAVAGTGLGLSIVKSIVEVHDGTIAVSSTEGVGTTFNVQLPARERASAGTVELMEEHDER
ncbi:sensor histidine kinase [Cellulomonas edaphi]|uniref:histidine kinase n=1 Tax=Cellulomonas edaphi TaxID=3053468 RepID=A0ABT7S4Q4_9CELL|nr:HAMP domain-containing sensor histidine kinase [Cellulomons edaphi]MDM7830597.1 HAMP domain-containing sensor histidine kinase [Cellulomons edaphi]